jgi:hypothetical protein
MNNERRRRAGAGVNPASNQPEPNDAGYTTEAQPSQGLSDWYGDEHPYYRLQELLEDAEFLCIRDRIPTIRQFVYRVIKLIPYYDRQVGGAARRLTPVVELLSTQIFLNPKLTRAIAEKALGEAIRYVTNLIVADEDAKYPGCRKDGKLIIDNKVERQ